MKKLNRKFIKGTNWALAGLLSFLGFSSCAGAEEYGSPHADFVVSGKVTDTDGKGLQGIRVVVPGVDHHNRKATPGYFKPYSPPVIYKPVNDTLYTKEGGRFDYTYGVSYVDDSINVNMKFEDISENAGFETDSTKVMFYDSELKGGKGWYEGKAKREINIKLKRKESE